jgi:hypothetical protein
MVGLLLLRGLWLRMMGKLPFFLSFSLVAFCLLLGGVLSGAVIAICLSLSSGEVALREEAGGSHSMARFW